MTPTPPWWAGLTASPESRELGIEWRDLGDWDAGEGSKSLFGTMRTSGDTALDERIREGKLLVGSGPQMTRRAMGIEVPVEWYLDPADPARLWCALGGFYAAWLWVPVDPEPGALAEVVSPSHPTPELTRLGMTRFTRGFLGFRSQVVVPHVYSGDLVEFNGHDLDRYRTHSQCTALQGGGEANLRTALTSAVATGPHCSRRSIRRHVALRRSAMSSGSGHRRRRLPRPAGAGRRGGAGSHAWSWSHSGTSLIMVP